MATLGSRLTDSQVRIGKKKMFFIDPIKGIRSKVYQPVAVKDFENEKKTIKIIAEKRSTVVLDESLEERLSLPFSLSSPYEIARSLLKMSMFKQMNQFRELIGLSFESYETDYVVDRARAIYAGHNPQEGFSEFLSEISGNISVAACINAYGKLLESGKYEAARMFADRKMIADPEGKAYDLVCKMHDRVNARWDADNQLSNPVEFSRTLNQIIDIIEQTGIKDKMDWRIPLKEHWSDLLSETHPSEGSRLALFDRLTGFLGLQAAEANKCLAYAYVQLSERKTPDDSTSNSILERFIGLSDEFSDSFSQAYRNQLNARRFESAKMIRPRVQDPLAIERAAADDIAARLFRPAVKRSSDKAAKKYVLNESEMGAIRELACFADRSALNEADGARAYTILLSGDAFLSSKSYSKLYYGRYCGSQTYEDEMDEADKIAGIYQLTDEARQRGRLAAYSTRLMKADSSAVKLFRSMYGFDARTDTKLFLEEPSKYSGPKTLGLIEVEKTPEALEAAKVLLKESMVGPHARNDRTEIIMRKFGIEKDYAQGMAMEHIKGLYRTKEPSQIGVLVGRLVTGGYASQEDCTMLGLQVIAGLQENGRYSEAGRLARYALNDENLARECIKDALQKENLTRQHAAMLAKNYGLSLSEHYKPTE
jgi:hypothetical protein